MTANTASNVELIPVRSSRTLMGLGNLTRKEFSLWWGTKLWWIQTLIWLVVLNFVSTMVMRDRGGMTDAALVDEALQTFFLVGATAIPIAIVLTLQGAIVGERELGTASWVLSKPASRVSFVLSKLIGHFTGMAVTAIIIPSAVFLLTARLMVAEPIDIGAFAIGMAVMGLVVLFYVTFTLTLGCLFKGRGPVAGIGITLVLMGQFFKGMLPLPIVLATPWTLGDVAASFPMHELPQFDRAVPLVVVAVETIVFWLVAISRFRREEF
jgi:ABC-2 type transport system permease protein